MLLDGIRRQRREPEFAATLLLVSTGKGGPCGMVGPSEPGTYFELSVSRTLDAALRRRDLEPTARHTLEHALRELPRHGALNCSIWGRDDGAR